MSSNEIKVDGALLEHLITTINDNTSSLHELRGETQAENLKRDKRIRWSRLASVIAVVVGVIGIVVGAVGINSAQEAHSAAAKASVALAAITTARAAAQRSTCNGFEAFSNALIGLSPRSTTDADRALRQARIDSFEKDLETRLSALHCDLHLLPAQ